MRQFSRHAYEHTQIPLFAPSPRCFPRCACHQARQQVTEDVMLMAGSSTEAPGPAQTTGGSYLLTNGIWCWAWAALTGGFYWLKEHDIMAVFSSMPLWQSGWRCRERRHSVTQRCRALLNRWQETSEESGNGQQMEKRSCRRPEECSVYTRHAASPPAPARTSTWWVYFLVFPHVWRSGWHLDIAQFQKKRNAQKGQNRTVCIC